MVFQSSRNIYGISVLWLIVIVLFATPFLPEKPDETPRQLIYACVLLYGIALMMVWILLDTNYKIDEKFLHYASGPIRGKIEIAKIHKLENVKTWYVSSIIKPGLDSYGLTVKYEKFNDIYISPKNKQEFIEALLKVNPEIIVE